MAKVIYSSFNELISSRSELPKDAVKSGSFASLTSAVPHIADFATKANKPIFVRLTWKKDNVLKYAEGAIFNNCKPEMSEIQPVNDIFAQIEDKHQSILQKPNFWKKSVSLEVTEYNGKFYPKFAGTL